MQHEVEIRDLGQMAYGECWELQRALFDALCKKKAEKRLIDDEPRGTILIVEHPAVYTLGKSGHQENMLVTETFSFTKNEPYTLCVSRDFLHEGDKVLFIDDFLAKGNASKSIIDLVKLAGAELVGMGFLIEKAFQGGGAPLRDAGIHVESLAIIESLDNCEIKFKND